MSLEKNKFKKTSEQVIRFDSLPAYFKVRTFQYAEPCSNPIAEFMKTKYFLWQETFRNEIKVSIDQSEQIVDWNFHGLYDVKKIRAAHFIQVSAWEFVDQFLNSLEKGVRLDKNWSDSKKKLNQLVELEAEYYLINNLTTDFHHAWTVFDSFLSGFKVSKDHKMLTAIEYGID